MSESRKSKLGRLRAMRKRIRRCSVGSLTWRQLHELHRKLMIEVYPTIGQFDDEVERLAKTGFYVP